MINGELHISNGLVDELSLHTGSSRKCNYELNSLSRLHNRNMVNFGR
jgi:hypothetical protein